MKNRASPVRAILAATIVLSLWLASASAQTYSFSPWAGTDSAGYADGVGRAALFNRPADVAVDASGTLFVADCANHVIRKITPAGLVSTLAGVAGQPGSADGSGAAARFNSPRSLTIDRSGNLYVADDQTIRKITPEGVVSTLAGKAGEPGASDGVGSAARFSFGRVFFNSDPHAGGVVADANGNIYVADTGNATIRKVTAEGVVTTVAGKAGEHGDLDGNGSAARFHLPNRLAVDRTGTVFVSDSPDGDYSLYGLVGGEGPFGVVRKITPSGDVTTFARPYTPTEGLAVDGGGTLYITNSTDSSGNLDSTISKISPAGVISIFAGGGGSFPPPQDGQGDVAGFFSPQGLSVDERGNVFVADTRNHAIRKITASGEVTTVAGNLSASVDGPPGEARFKAIEALATDSVGNLYVFDDGAIRRIGLDGSVVTLAGVAGQRGTQDGTGSAARFTSAGSMAVDGLGNVFTGSLSLNLRKITPAGVVSTISARDPVTGIAAEVRGMVADRAGNLVFATPWTVYRVTPGGVVSILAGEPPPLPSPGSGPITVPPAADGIGTAAHFRSIHGLAMNSRGEIFVSDTRSIRRISPDGTVTTFAGTLPDTSPFASNEGQFVDGPVAAARFASPGPLTIDGADNIFIGDNGALRKISNGSVTTLLQGGNLNFGGAFFFPPVPMAADPSGRLYLISRGDPWSRTILRGIAPAEGSPPSRLRNASVLANLRPQQPLIVGFNLRGGARPLLLRAIGPGLQPFAPAAAVASDPRLDLFDRSGALLASNNNWDGSPALVDSFVAAGAFPLAAGSADAALLQTTAGPGTMHVASPAGGMALLELFDVAPPAAAGIANVSARKTMGAGADSSLTLGFFIEGPSAKTVLIRGIGPGLAAPPFNLGNALSAPLVTVSNTAGKTIWTAYPFSSFAPTILPIASSRAGAFPLAQGSLDVAFLLTLDPGSYTAVLSAFSGASGEAMVEIYEVP